MEEENFSPEESLQIIQSMINKAKFDYEETGVSALLWGSIITFCSLITFGNFWWRQDWLNYVWLLTIAAITPQIIISIRESKRKKFKAHDDAAIGGIWISYAVGVILLSVYTSIFKTENEVMLYLIIYGVPTFATGFALKFSPMIIGGIACWVLAIGSIYVGFPYAMLLSAAAAQVAWFIPGLILRRRYLQLKKENV
jgi:hypothetical protein